MTRYYVYTVKTDDPLERVNAYVSDPSVFAMTRFDPANMEFSGVFVEADDIDKASVIYLHPQAEDVFVSCDEPGPTIMKRRVFETRLRLLESKLDNIREAEIETQRLRLNNLTELIKGDFQNIAERTSEFARLFKALTKDSDEVSAEEIYERLLGKYAKQLPKLRYRPRSNGPF